MTEVLLIGLDGATYSLLDPMMERGLMPHLSALTGSGARAPLASVMPPITPPGWTSLMTGKPPGQHGVFDFFQKEDPTSPFFRLTTSQDIGAQTIWSLASQHGKRVTALNFPLMFPAPPVNGYVVPGGWMPWRQLRLGCHPPDLFDRLKMLPSFNARELALDMALEEKALDGCEPNEYGDWVRLHTRREQRWLDVARYLMSVDPTDLVGIVFDGVDKLHHLVWRFMDPDLRHTQATDWAREISALCDGYFTQLDATIGELVRMAGPEATVVLASDHGGGPNDEVFYLNSWLEREGYLKWASDDATEQQSAPSLGFRHIARHIQDLDWTETRAYAATPSSNGIHIVRRRPDGTEVGSASERAQLKAELVEKLRDLRHPNSGEHLVTAIGTDDEVFDGPFSAFAPDVSVMLVDGCVVSILRAASIVETRPEIMGTHRTDGIFAAFGPRVQPGISVERLSIMDVAALLLYCMNLPVPSDMLGRVPVEILRPEELRQQPVRIGAADTHQLTPVGVSSMDSDAESVIVNRLRALGYTE